MLVRTTLRIEDHLKKDAQRKAFEEDITLQDIFNKALKEYLKSQAKKKAKKIIFKSFDLGVPLDKLTRSDFYPEPK